MSTDRIRVAVIGGGQNCEHAVSVASAESVTRALDPDRYDVVTLTIAADGRWLSAGAELGNTPAASLAAAVARLGEQDVVVPLVHGRHGEDGTLAALCDLAGVPYVGSGVRAGALAMDKWATKLVAEALGIRTARGVLVTAASAASAASVRWTGPVVVKPVETGSSHGVTLVERADELGPALDAAFGLDDRALIEEFVDGREIDIAVFRAADGGWRVSPPLEIDVDGIFDTSRKYDGTAPFRLPADLTPSEHSELSDAARRLFRALGCAGVARFDFFLTAAGLVLNEVNTAPGMTEQSQVPRMFAAAGLAYADLLDELVSAAVVPAPGRPGHDGLPVASAVDRLPVVGWNRSTRNSMVRSRASAADAGEPSHM